MLVAQPRSVSLTQVAVMALAAQGAIAQIYLHWTAGRYGQVYDDYHLNIDADGTIYCSCDCFTQQKCHTWHRNSGSIGIALCCGLGAEANNGFDADLGAFAPTELQVDMLGQVLALLAKGLALPLLPSVVMTHCEAALIDGYGPYSADPETRWDLWFLRDSASNAMHHGGQVLRGKALWYFSRLDEPYIN